MEDTVTLTAGEVATLEHVIETLEESLSDTQRLMAAEDYGWKAIGDLTGEGAMPRETAKEAVRLARVMAIADPLIRRAVSLHQAYVWGGGCTIAAKQEKEAQQDVNAAVQLFLDDPSNESTFTSGQAREEMERKLKTDGEMFHALVTSPLLGRVQVREIPAFEVGDIIANPEDSAEVWFYKRVFTTRRLVAQGTTTNFATQQETIFYPDINYRPRTRLRTVDGYQVRWDSPVIHTKVNPSGGRGVPDLYSALPWAKGYKGFLEDWALLVRALSKFAFRATSKTRTGAAAMRNTIATRAADPNGQVGALAITGEDQKFEAIGKSGATIDADSGRPLAAMVAAGTNTPVTMLLADPGVTGARATAETLDDPFHRVIKARQTLFADLIRAVLGHVIRESVRAPQGILKGTILRDPTTDREVVVLRGDQESTVEVIFPSMDKTDIKTQMEAISKADSLDKLPPLLVAQLAMMALDVPDVDEWLEKITDENGDFKSPTDAAAARDQQDAVARGDLPQE